MVLSQSSLALLIVLVIPIANVDCSNILVVPSINAGSRLFVLDGIAKTLAERGHNVTMAVSSLFYENIARTTMKWNISLQVYNGVVDLKDPMSKNLFSDVVLRGDIGLLQVSGVLYGFAEECSSMFADDNFLKGLQMSTFDLVVACEFTPCPALLAHYLDRPFVMVGAARMIPVWDADMYNVPNNPAYIPCVGTGFTDEMDFFQRTYNSVYFMIRYLAANFIFAVYGTIKRQYNIKPELGMRDIYADAELFIINTDIVINAPRPIMPNVVFLGIDLLIKPVNALEKELDDFVESSGRHGIVVFTIGTHAHFTKEGQLRKITDGLGKLAQKVLIKYNGDSVPSYLQGNNQFKLMNWLPQNDLLGHPKAKAFLYHGGVNGVHEAIHHAIPMVGIPLFYDQHENVEIIAKYGMGLVLNMKTFTSDDLYKAVNTVITDPSYKENAVLLSRMLKDKPMSANETIIYWVEHIIQYGGKHLKSQVANLNFFQYYLIDVFAFVAIISLFAAYITFKVSTFMYRLLCNNPKEKVN